MGWVSFYYRRTKRWRGAWGIARRPLGWLVWLACLFIPSTNWVRRNKIEKWYRYLYYYDNPRLVRGLRKALSTGEIGRWGGMRFFSRSDVSSVTMVSTKRGEREQDKD